MPRHPPSRPVRQRSAKASAPPLPSDLIARMGHALRTPLNAILGFSELMAVGTFGPLRNARYLEYVRLIHRSAASLLATIDGLQRLVRLREGAIAPARTAFELDRAAHAALEAVGGEAARRRIVLRLERPKRSVMVAGDRDMIVELLTELARNAVTFTPDGGRVLLRVAGGARGARLQVVDSGVGVAAADRRRAFDPFVQLKPSGVPPHEGAGLGLAIAAAIADGHGGAVRLDAAPGGGTCVTLTLPAAPRRATVRTRSSAARRAPSGKRSR